MERGREPLYCALLEVEIDGKVKRQHFLVWRSEWRRIQKTKAFYTRNGGDRLAQRVLWITYLRKQNPEVFYVEGAFDEIFKDASLKARKANWDPEKKRWVVQKEHLPAIKFEAQQTFEVVMYGEGGDFVEL